MGICSLAQISPATIDTIIGLATMPRASGISVDSVIRPCRATVINSVTSVETPPRSMVSTISTTPIAAG